MDQKSSRRFGNLEKVATTVYKDEQSSSSIAKNEVSRWAKYINNCHSFISEKVKSGYIEVKYVDSKCQGADCLKKPMPTEQFHDLMKNSNVVDQKSRDSVGGVYHIRHERPC